jgi:hypothetical protein
MRRMVEGADRPFTAPRGVVAMRAVTARRREREAQRRCGTRIGYAGSVSVPISAADPLLPFTERLPNGMT